jgi:hypothetical protein
MSSSDGMPQVILRLSLEPDGLAIIIDLLSANLLWVWSKNKCQKGGQFHAVSNGQRPTVSVII